MPVISTHSIVLHTFPYGESSKIVRLATQDHGVVSAIAKGARRTKSPFGARLQPLSSGTAQLYMKSNRTLHTLSAFDLERQREGIARNVERFGAASAATELVLRCADQDPNAGMFELLGAVLDQLEQVDVARLPVVSLSALWSLVCELGFTPSLDECVVDGREIGAGSAGFSVADGGCVCSICATGRDTAPLGASDREVLRYFVQGGELVLGPPDWSLSPSHAAAHRRLLSRFIRRHLSEGRDLTALTFWEGLPWDATQ